MRYNIPEMLTDDISFSVKVILIGYALSQFTLKIFIDMLLFFSNLLMFLNVAG